jgi:hypothetical protein
VNVHCLPVSVELTVLVPVSVTAAVAGAQLSVPCSPVCVVAAPLIVTAWSRASKRVVMRARGCRERKPDDDRDQQVLHAVPVPARAVGDA